MIRTDMLHSTIVIEVQYKPVQSSGKVIENINDDYDVQSINASCVRRASTGAPLRMMTGRAIEALGTGTAGAPARRRACQLANTTVFLRLRMMRLSRW
jgi:hypothetical protein